MDDNKKRILEEYVKYDLHWLIFEAEKNKQDEEPDFVEQLHNDFPICREMFPSVIKAIKTGSRAEKTHIDESTDTDFMYEIGPGTVSEKLSPKKTRFFWTKTSNPGFYRIENKYGEFLYPKMLQIKVKPLLDVGEEEENMITDRPYMYTNSTKYDEYPKAAKMRKQNFTKENLIKAARKRTRKSRDAGVKDDGDTKAALTSGQEDQIVAMRLEEWPSEIWKHIENKLCWCPEIRKKLKGTPLYFIPKCHPNSNRKKVEWRLSSSLVEKEVMLALPSNHKRAYMICKLLNKKNLMETVARSFHWKTSVLWKMDEYGDDMLNANSFQVYDLVKDFVQYLYNAFKERKLENYFVPGMDLFYTFTEEEMEQTEKALSKLLFELAETIHDQINVKKGRETYFSSSRFGHLCKSANLSHVDAISLATLDGYCDFMLSGFSVIKKIPFEKAEERSPSSYRFLAQISQNVKSIPAPVPEMSEDLQLLFDIQCKFPIVVLYDYGITGNVDRITSHIYASKFDETAPDDLVWELKRHKAKLYKLYKIMQHFSDREIKTNVLKYLKESGKIDVKQIMEDLTKYCEENKNDVMKWCEDIVSYLKENNRFGNLDLQTFFPTKDIRFPHKLSDILLTPIQRFLENLEYFLELYNKDWRNAKINLEERDSICEFLTMKIHNQHLHNDNNNDK